MYSVISYGHLVPSEFMWPPHLRLGVENMFLVFLLLLYMCTCDSVYLFLLTNNETQSTACTADLLNDPFLRVCICTPDHVHVCLCVQMMRHKLAKERAMASNRLPSKRVRLSACLEHRTSPDARERTHKLSLGLLNLVRHDLMSTRTSFPLVWCTSSDMI